MEEIFESSVRSRGDLGVVFEFDGDCAYFYLLDLAKDPGGQIIAATPIGDVDIGRLRVALQIRWSADERFVFLMDSGRVIAAFDGENAEAYSLQGCKIPLNCDFLAAIRAENLVH